ncbi:MAG: lysophospholipid acyltransferase family protein [Acidimicrobiales bacterium]
MNSHLAMYKAGERVASLLPTPLALRLGQWLGAGIGRLPDLDGKRAVVSSHMRLLMGEGLSSKQTRRLVAEVFGFYGRYWAESLRLPSLGAADVAAGVHMSGFENVERHLAAGTGVLLAAPHLGGWEWGATYLATGMGLPITVAVEPLDPPEVFEWFARFRERLGMNVVAVGAGAAKQITQALRNGHIVCLLSDRLVGGTTGVRVEFFGAPTSLPAGPVTLALRSEAPLVAAAIYYEGGCSAHRIVFRPPLSLSRSGNFRTDVQVGTQALARELEVLIRAAPTQWHLIQPNWPSDPQVHRVFRPRRAGVGRAAKVTEVQPSAALQGEPPASAVPSPSGK